MSQSSSPSLSEPVGWRETGTCMVQESLSGAEQDSAGGILCVLQCSDTQLCPGWQAGTGSPQSKVARWTGHASDTLGEQCLHGLAKKADGFIANDLC